LFEHLANADPARVPIVDRRLLGPDEAIARVAELITSASTDCLADPTTTGGGSMRCRPGCPPARGQT